MIEYEEKRILIWGKTYPELSSLYTETVCTGGVLEDGTPVRLYPIDYRYLEGEQQFSNYQWITARIGKSPRDNRPESFRIERDSIVCGEKIPSTNDEWGKRAEFILRDKSWIFPSVEALIQKYTEDKTSLGIVEPKEIFKVGLKVRTQEEKKEFDEKLEDLTVRNKAKRAQIPMFEDYSIPEFKKLSFVESRFEIQWRCFGEECNTHRTQVLDWGLIELLRRKGVNAAKSKLEDICDLSKYKLKFFMGNIHKHPTAFTVVGLWHPKKLSEPRLF